MSVFAWPIDRSTKSQCIGNYVQLQRQRIKKHVSAKASRPHLPTSIVLFYIENRSGQRLRYVYKLQHPSSPQGKKDVNWYFDPSVQNRRLFWLKIRKQTSSDPIRKAWVKSTTVASSKTINTERKQLQNQRWESRFYCIFGKGNQEKFVKINQRLEVYYQMRNAERKVAHV